MQLMECALDIETMPNSSMIEQLPEPELKLGNITDPRKIEAKKQEAKQSQIDKMALNPLFGRICAVVCYNNDGAGRYAIKADSDAEETELIEWLLTPFAEVRLITWNGMGFDLPFIYKRAMILGIDPRQFKAPPLSAFTKRYCTERHVDLMQIWSNWSSQGYEKLDTVSAFLLKRNKIAIDFKDFPELIKTEAGREKILTYNEQDTALTWALYQRFLGVLI